MSEMVDRIEMAINAEASRIAQLPMWERAVAQRHIGEYQARAALEAMREPTEDMIEMGFIKPPVFTHDSATVLDVYQAMIDAALK